MPFNLGMPGTGNVADVNSVAFGNASVIDTVGAFNGLLMIVDVVPLFAGEMAPPSGVCGP